MVLKNNHFENSVFFVKSFLVTFHFAAFKELSLFEVAGEVGNCHPGKCLGTARNARGYLEKREI